MSLRTISEVSVIASKVDMDARKFEIMLKQLYNLDSQNVRRDGKRGRRYLLEDKDKVKKILET